MQSKFVFITEMKTDKTRNGRDYVYCFDQDKLRWNLFNGERVELNKAYVFRFEQNGEYNNIKEIEPVINVLKVEVMKDLASRNDVIRNYSTFFSYAKDLCVGGKIEKTEMFSMAESIYTWINEKADEVMAESSKPIDKGLTNG